MPSPGERPGRSPAVFAEHLGERARALAHELNNLLALVTSYTELAWEHVADRPSAAHDLAHVRDAAERAAHLVRDLYALTDVDLAAHGRRRPPVSRTAARARTER